MITYKQILEEAGKDAPWSRILDLTYDRAESAAHCRELTEAYKVHRGDIEREAFKACVRRGGMRHVGNSGRV